MTFTPAYVQIAPNSTGAMIDGAQVTDGGQTVMRQIVSLGDPTTPGNVVQVLNTSPVGTEYGSVVRSIDPDAVTLQTATITTPGIQTSVNTNGWDALVIQIVGTWQGSITVEGSSDQSAGSWTQLQFRKLDDLISQDTIQQSGIYLLKVSTLYTRLNVQGIVGSINTNVMGRTIYSDLGMESLTQALDPSTGVSLSITPGLPGQQLSSQSFPVTLAKDQTQDLALNGPAGMFQLNANALTGNASVLDTVVNGSISYRSFTVQINGNAGITAGAVTFQGSNDGTNWVSIPVYDQAVITGTTIQGSITIAASTFRFFSGKCIFRYLKCAVTTAFTGSWIQCFIRLSTKDITVPVLSVGQPTAANLQTTATISGSPTVLIGNTANTTPILDSVCPNTSATAALTSLNVNASGTLTALKGSVGNLYGFSIYNNTASVAFLEFWNVASGSVTLGTTPPTNVYIIPASGSLTLCTDIAQMNGASAMSYACVSAYNGATPVSITGSIFFK